jgi:hypothetical protein
MLPDALPGSQNQGQQQEHAAGGCTGGRGRGCGRGHQQRHVCGFRGSRGVSKGTYGESNQQGHVWAVENLAEARMESRVVCRGTYGESTIDPCVAPPVLGEPSPWEYDVIVFAHSIMCRRKELAASLRRALDTADVVVTTGGM